MLQKKLIKFLLKYWIPPRKEGWKLFTGTRRPASFLRIETFGNVFFPGEGIRAVAAPFFGVKSDRSVQHVNEIISMFSFKSVENGRGQWCSVLVKKKKKKKMVSCTHSQVLTSPEWVFISSKWTWINVFDKKRNIYNIYLYILETCPLLSFHPDLRDSFESLQRSEWQKKDGLISHWGRSSSKKSGVATELPSSSEASVAEEESSGSCGGVGGDVIPEPTPFCFLRRAAHPL